GPPRERARRGPERASHSCPPARRTGMRPSLAAALLASVLLAAPASADAPLPPPPPLPPRPCAPLVVYVVVPLCSNQQIDCGSVIAGRPGDLAHNVYWGAVFGDRRFLARKGSG